VHTAPVPTDGAPRSYHLAGLVYCGICGRAMDAHWVHERAGYRCRHGHSSARPRSSDRSKTLYVREDHLLDRVRGDRQLRRLAESGGQGASVDQDASAVAGFLRTHNMIIIGDHATWAVESDNARIELAPTPRLPFPPSIVSAQREQFHTEAEQSSRSVWK